MKWMFALFALGSSALAAPSAPPAPAQLLSKPKALPLALTDDFQFRKILTTEIGGAGREATNLIKGKSGQQLEEMIGFEERYRMHGAISELDRRERRGQYFTFFWRATHPANLTLRLEYRQEKLGAYIQAREVNLGEVKGSGRTEIAIVGDDYIWEGRISAWRVMLVENGQVVALKSSALWN